MRRRVAEEIRKGRLSVPDAMSDAFDRHFTAVYQDRWPELREALAVDKHQIKRLNRFADVPVDRLHPQSIPAFPNCFPNPDKSRPEPAPNGLLDFYMMDLASVQVAEALEAEMHHRVLDLCAAPGGKTLALAEKIGPEGRLFANERSTIRRNKMRALIEAYLPADIRDRVIVTGHDGLKLGLREKDTYDRILVDAPCSSERHLIGSPHMSQWKPSRTRMMATRQHALLCSALMALKPGGTMVYSTCSISPVENDQVIDRLLKKRSHLVEPIRVASKLGERTKHGWSILPDTTGYGPMYYCVLRKTEDAPE